MTKTLEKSYGGGLCTREATLPGSNHNLHSINRLHIGETPSSKEFGLDPRVNRMAPRYEFAQAHSGGTLPTEGCAMLEKHVKNEKAA